jgi:hypothetical protein
MAQSDHLILSGDAEHGYTAYCGHKQQSKWRLVADPAKMDCSKCSAKYYAEQIKDLPYRLGARLDLSKDQCSDYKSIYPIHQKADDALIGFVTIKHGWGKPWYVHCLESGRTTEEHLTDDTVPEPVMSNESVSYKRTPDDRREYAHSFHSKEQALSTVPLMAEQGKFSTREAIISDTRATYVRLRAYRANQKVKADQKAADLAMINEEIEAILASGTLTNRQQMAFSKALEIVRHADLLGA